MEEGSATNEQVSNHYNAIPNAGIDAREESKIV